MASTEKCKNHPNVNAIEDCAVCGTPMCGMCSNFTNDGVLCEKCEKHQESARFVTSQSDQLNQPKKPVVPMQVADATPQQVKRKSDSRFSWAWALAIVFTLLIAAQLYLGSRSEFVPMDAETIARENTVMPLAGCIAVFQQIGVMLQNDRLPPDDLRCDQSGVPNIVTRTGDNILVEYPHPDFYGYVRFYVTNQNPEPVLQE